ncbi:DUF7575 domain-containing protein [Halostella litorea]|uniref:DUF7575 domain-containing protein n=1 Tax=Halostella litorea TaxID=2528831 RepID=UPI001092E675|nr:zinc ribbon domain-containing protein [Halostella litorea]
MRESIQRKRPWLAALLAAFVTGLGHLYLRRWRRAVTWLLALFVATVLFVDPATAEALANGDAVDPAAIAPVLVVGAFSVFDAYALARAHNAVARVTAPTDGRRSHCPNCGRELDPEIEFCHWCNADVTDPDPDAATATDGWDD